MSWSVTIDQLCCLSYSRFLHFYIVFFASGEALAALSSEGFFLGNVPLWLGGTPEAYSRVPEVHNGFSNASATVGGWGRSPD